MISFLLYSFQLTSFLLNLLLKYSVWKSCSFILLWPSRPPDGSAASGPPIQTFHFSYFLSPLLLSFILHYCPAMRAANQSERGNKKARLAVASCRLVVLAGGVHGCLALYPIRTHQTGQVECDTQSAGFIRELCYAEAAGSSVLAGGTPLGGAAPSGGPRLCGVAAGPLGGIRENQGCIREQ